MASVVAFCSDLLFIQCPVCQLDTISAQRNVADPIVDAATGRRGKIFRAHICTEQSNDRTFFMTFISVWFNRGDHVTRAHSPSLSHAMRHGCSCVAM